MPEEEKYNIGNFAIGNLFVDRPTKELHDNLEKLRSRLMNAEERLNKIYDREEDTDEPEKEEQETKELEEKIKGLKEEIAVKQVEFEKIMKEKYPDYGKVIV